MAVPAGYMKDSGALFGDRGNGYMYGWSCDLEALGDYRDRDGAHTRESSLIIPDRSQNCATETWNIELPNGDYSVVIGYSDPSYNTAVDGCVLEGASAATGVGSDLHGDGDGSRQASEALVMAGVPVEHVTDVTVTDGTLTFDGEWGSPDGRHCQSVSYMHIQPLANIIKINFQPPDMTVPDGYLKDSGGLYGIHTNGYSYGWSCDLETLGDYRDRGSMGTVESSLVIPDRSQNCETENWRMAVPNGPYVVTIGFSDPSYDTDVSGCTIQGDVAAAQQHGGARGDATVVAGTVTEHHAQVDVEDGFITFDGEWQSPDGLHCQSVSYMVIEAGTRSRYRHTHANGVVSSTQMIGNSVWFEIGSAMTTYASGAQHCASSLLTLCCYEDYCPQGAASPPLGGTRNGDEWAPTRDQENSWVQVGLWGGDAANTCVLHQDLSGGIYGLPGWGATADSAGHQGWVLCCEATADNSCAAVGGSSGSELNPGDMLAGGGR